MTLRRRDILPALLVAFSFLPSALEAQQPATLPEAPSTGLPVAGAASISGVVLDVNGGIVPDAHVVLTDQDGAEQATATSGSDGSFLFSDLPPGTYRLRISSPGLETFLSRAIALRSGERFHLLRTALPIAPGSASVTVTVTEDEIATEQVHAQIEQRAFGVFPNFYTSYLWNPAPLKPRHKFYLALRATTDPINFLTTAGVAGAEQIRGTHPGYGDGIAGYSRRYGADFGNLVIGRVIGAAILPSIFHQDPRYFYQGSGSVTSRSVHALGSTFITRGDSGGNQPNFSYLVGIFAAAGITNLYYPDNDRTASTIVDNVLIRIGAHSVGNLVREFISRKITPKVPVYATGKPLPSSNKPLPPSAQPQSSGVKP